MTRTSADETRWETWEQELLARTAEFGITRVADTTGMDILGMPTASATKPATSDAIWVYSGKGHTRAHARVTAIMECLERSGALWPSDPTCVTEVPSVLRRSHEVWEPHRFTYRQHPKFNDDDPQLWIEATALSPTTRPVMVPADLCYNGRRPHNLTVASPFVVATSNGLAAAFTTEDALQHALSEVIERDIISSAEVRASHLGYRFLAAVAEKLGLSRSALDAYEDNIDLATTIDPASLPEQSRNLADHYRAADLDLVIKHLPNDFGLPAFGVAAVQQVDMTRYLGCAGYAVRASSATAINAALLELAQTRATDLQGAREDRHEVEKQRLDQLPHHHWLATPGTQTTAYEPVDTPAGLAPLLSACGRAGLPDVAYVEFPGWQGISVVRVLVPDAETWHITGGWSNLGPRLRAKTGGT